MSIATANESLVTCPACGHQSLEEMPEFSCLLANTCTVCGEVMCPSEDDCCIFCTYGTMPCPPIQIGRQGGEGEGCG